MWNICVWYICIHPYVLVSTLHASVTMYPYAPICNHMHPYAPICTHMHPYAPMHMPLPRIQMGRNRGGRLTCVLHPKKGQ